MVYELPQYGPGLDDYGSAWGTDSGGDYGPPAGGGDDYAALLAEKNRPKERRLVPGQFGYAMVQERPSGVYSDPEQGWVTTSQTRAYEDSSGGGGGGGGSAPAFSSTSDAFYERLVEDRRQFDASIAQKQQEIDQRQREQEAAQARGDYQFAQRLEYDIARDRDQLVQSQQAQAQRELEFERSYGLNREQFDYQRSADDRRLGLDEKRYGLDERRYGLEEQTTNRRLGLDERAQGFLEERFGKEMGLREKESAQGYSIDLKKLGLQERGLAIDARRAELEAQIASGRLSVDKARLQLDKEIESGKLQLGREELELNKELGRGKLGLDTRRMDFDERQAKQKEARELLTTFTDRFGKDPVRQALFALKLKGGRTPEEAMFGTLSAGRGGGGPVQPMNPQAQQGAVLVGEQGPEVAVPKPEGGMDVIPIKGAAATGGSFDASGNRANDQRRLRADSLGWDINYNPTVDPRRGLGLTPRRVDPMTNAGTGWVSQYLDAMKMGDPTRANAIQRANAGLSNIPAGIRAINPFNRPLGPSMTDPSQTNPNYDRDKLALAREQQAALLEQQASRGWANAQAGRDPNVQWSIPSPIYGAGNQPSAERRGMKLQPRPSLGINGKKLGGAPPPVQTQPVGQPQPVQPGAPGSVAQGGGPGWWAGDPTYNAIVGGADEGAASTAYALNRALGFNDNRISIDSNQGVMGLPEAEQAALSYQMNGFPVKSLLESGYGVGGIGGGMPAEEFVRRITDVTPRGSSRY